MASITAALPPRRHWSVLLFLVSIINLPLSYVRIILFDGSTYPRTFIQSTSFLDYASYERFHVLSVVFPWIGAVVLGFGLWIFAPYVSILRSTITRWLISLLSIVVFAMSVCFSSFVLFFAPPSGFQVTANIDQYEVGLTQIYSYDPFIDSSLSLTVIRDDGKVYIKRLQYIMEPRDKMKTICETLSIKTKGDYRYFLCDNERISRRTPYINMRERAIYFGWGSNTESDIDSLSFR
jgi:hypothetical protein